MIRINLVLDLRNQAGTVDSLICVMGKTVVGDGFGGVYFWDATSVATDDGMIVLKPTNTVTGRWRKLKGLDTLTGTFTGSGTALTTSYVVTHNLGLIPSIVLPSAQSAAASGTHYISAKTATTFTITFNNVPNLGTNNLIFDWLVKA